MTTGQLIKAARKKAGMTQEDLGERLGVSGSFIAQYETNNRNPKLETLQRIAAALGTTVNRLLPPDNYWENEEGVGHTQPMMPSEQELDQRLRKSYDNMTLEGKGKVVDYAEDILPRYKAGSGPSDGGGAAPAPQEDKDTTPPQEGSEGPTESE